MHEMDKIENKEMEEVDVQQISDKDIERLEYLEEMNVINEEEKAILEAVRKTRNINHMPITQQSRMAKPKGKMPINNFVPAKSNYYEQMEQQEPVGPYKPVANYGNYNYY